MTKRGKAVLVGMLGTIKQTPRTVKHALRKTMHKNKEHKRLQARRARMPAKFDKPEPGA